MNVHTFLLLGAALAAPVAGASDKEAVFHPLWVPPGKTAQDLKPRPEARADEPIVLELRAHRHPDGSLHFECDHLPLARQPEPVGGPQR